MASEHAQGAAGKGGAAPRVSVILPTLNGEEDLRRQLPVLRSQAVDFEVEICAIDSESTDGTRAVLAEYGARVRSVRKADFRHGATRNLCAEDARGEFLVFLSQDVVPADEHFLGPLIAAFDDPRIAGAYSRVLPHPDDDALTTRTVLDLPEASGEPWVRDLDEIGPVWDLEPWERGLYLRFNNVASAIRTSVFREIPFPDMDFAEDFAWAARALTAGWRIAFVPESRAMHAHTYDVRKAFERYRVDAAFHRDVHGWRMRPSLLSAMRGIAYEVWQDARFILGGQATGSGRWRSLIESPALRTAQVMGQYVGSR